MSRMWAGQEHEVGREGARGGGRAGAGGGEGRSRMEVCTIWKSSRVDKCINDCYHGHVVLSTVYCLLFLLLYNSSSVADLCRHVCSCFFLCQVSVSDPIMCGAMTIDHGLLAKAMVKEIQHTEDIEFHDVCG